MPSFCPLLLVELDFLASVPVELVCLEFPLLLLLLLLETSDVLLDARKVPTLCAELPTVSVSGVRRL